MHGVGYSLTLFTVRTYLIEARDVVSSLTNFPFDARVTIIA